MSTICFETELYKINLTILRLPGVPPRASVTRMTMVSGRSWRSFSAVLEPDGGGHPETIEPLV